MLTISLGTWPNGLIFDVGYWLGRAKTCNQVAAYFLQCIQPTRTPRGHLP